MNEILLYISDQSSLNPAPTTQKFVTTSDLLNIDIVKLVWEVKEFSRFALFGHLLIAIMAGDDKQWVIGCIKDPSSVVIPEWDGNGQRTTDNATH